MLKVCNLKINRAAPLHYAEFSCIFVCFPVFLEGLQMELLIAETFPEQKQKDDGAAILLIYSFITLHCKIWPAIWVMMAAFVELRLSGLLLSISLSFVDFMCIFQPVI